MWWTPKGLRVAIVAAAAAVLLGFAWLAATSPKERRKHDDDDHLDDVDAEPTAPGGAPVSSADASLSKADPAAGKTQEQAAAAAAARGSETKTTEAPATKTSTASSSSSSSSSPEAAVKAEFNLAKQKAFELFKASPPQYEEAAAWFSKAIAVADAHASLASQRVALYNNRSACRERVGALDESLADCAAVLALNPTHAKVRRRRARVYEKKGCHSEALVEICADLLIQREDFKKALKEGKTPEQPTPVDNVEVVMRAVGREAADRVLKERDNSPGGFSFGMPSSNTVTQLLATYVDFADRKAAAEAEVDDAELAKLVEMSASSLPALGEKIRHRLRRVSKWTYSKRYDDAKAEVDVALKEYLDATSTETSSSSPPRQQAAAATEESSFPAAVAADLFRQVGLYRHLAHDLAGAADAYARALEFETDAKLRAETRVKAAGVQVDAGDPEAADKELNLALEEDRDSSDVYMHRAQLHVIKRDLVAAQRDLETCIAAAPAHVLARLRLATVLIHNNASQRDVERHVSAAETLAPDMSEVYQVRGEILLSRNDLHGAIAQFDKAIDLDPTNPVPLYNKGMALIQLDSFQTDRTKDLFEAALRVDPTCMVALMRLSELKLQLAATFDQAQDVVDM